MSPHRVVHRVVLATAAVALVAAGCSGDDESTTPSSTDPVTTAAASTTTTTTASSTTTAPTTTAPTTTAPVVDAAWCGPAADVRAASDRFTRVSTDPDELRDVVSELVVALGAAEGAAPDELHDEVAVVAAGADELQRALDATDYDILTADLSGFSLLEGDLEAANEVIREFNVAHCGFDEDPDAEEGDDGDAEEDDGFDFGDGTFRDQFLGQLADAGFTPAEAECIFAEIDFADPDSYSSDAAIVEIFVACGIDLARIGELQVTGG